MELFSGIPGLHIIFDDLLIAAHVLVHNNKVIIPLLLRPKMLGIIHEGHLRIEKCKSLTRQSLYWPGLKRGIEELIGKCSICNSYRRKQQQKPLFAHSVPHRPWQKLGADMFSLRNKDYLLIVDHYRKCPEISMLHDKTASFVFTSVKSVLHDMECQMRSWQIICFLHRKI